MALNAALRGKAYPPRVLALDAQRVSSFSRAIGHPGDGVPPTFVTAPEIAAGLWSVVEDPDLGLDLAGVLHGEQEYEWGRPLVVGELLTAEATIQDIRGRGGVEFLTLRTELRDEGGAVVCVARSTLIVRGDGG